MTIKSKHLISILIAVAGCHGKGEPTAPPAPLRPEPDLDQPLKLVVSVARDRMILWSISGLEGTLATPKRVFPRAGRDGDPAPTPAFDYRALSRALFEIANRRYAGKVRKQDTYQIILMADRAIPYNTIASVMAAMRCKMPDFGKEPTECALPTDDPELKKAKDPMSPDKRLYDTSRASYDPETMALFSDVLFSSGSE